MLRLILIGGLLVVLAGGAAAFAATHRAQTFPQTARLEGANVWPAGARPAPSFALHDQDGRIVTPHTLRGRVWAMAFLDSHCRTLCPVEAREVAQAERELGPRYPLELVVVSVLPSYDTPARVRAFMEKAGLTGNWHWLLGTRKQLEPVWVRYGIYVKTGIEHTSALYLVSQQGDVRVADGVPLLPAQLAASVRALEKPAPHRVNAGGLKS